MSECVKGKKHYANAIGGARSCCCAAHHTLLRYTLKQGDLASISVLLVDSVSGSARSISADARRAMRLA